MKKNGVWCQWDYRARPYARMYIHRSSILGWITVLYVCGTSWVMFMMCIVRRCAEAGALYMRACRGQHLFQAYSALLGIFGAHLNRREMQAMCMQL